MRQIRKIVVHTSATPTKMNIGVKEIDRWHRERGFLRIGYHYVIRRDGTLERGRPDHLQGAHVSGHNSDSLGICMVGGVDKNGKAEDNYTEAQFDTLHREIDRLLHEYPEATVLGHRDLSPDIDGDGIIGPHEWLKECPCFNVGEWWNEISITR